MMIIRDAFFKTSLELVQDEIAVHSLVEAAVDSGEQKKTATSDP
tara:strand:+ start:779 stop:910 length:132 start_codon:yes stop_codon:yes gene_type:complete